MQQRISGSTTIFFFIFFWIISVAAYAQVFKAVDFSKVTITDSFWKPRLESIADKTLQACILHTEIKTPRIRNFEKVVRKQGEPHEGIYYDDSDVYKAIEAIAYSLFHFPDQELEATADRWIDLISKAQLPDGYLNTFYQLGNLSARWTDIEKHEDYCAGHLIEAAIAYYKTTGKNKLLKVAIRFADHIDSTLRLGEKPWFSGHQEIELALIKLYEVTGNPRYLKLVEWYLEQRGKGHYRYGSNWITADYWQDLHPIENQYEITGHAVRAMYQFCGTADAIAITGNKQYEKALNAVWNDVVHRNLYITGGIGSSGRNEGFSADYDLPNLQAYCETCASVGMIFWNHRMHRIYGDADYMDVLERSLYNGALAGISLTGDRFFYGNPLASYGTHVRREWFGTACCPSNIARLTASVGNYIYSVSDDGLWVNLFIGSSAAVEINKRTTNISVSTNYPWDGNIELNFDLKGRSLFNVYIRIPGWVRGSPVPGELYSWVIKEPGEFRPELRVNGKIVQYTIQRGYAVINRAWRKGDRISMELPMPVMEIQARSEVVQNRGRIALQRGPLLYCVEGADNENQAWNFIVPEGTTYLALFDKELLGGITKIDFDGIVFEGTGDGNLIKSEKRTITAIPYYAWCNRGQNEMQVWLPRKVNEIRINPER